MPCNKEDVAPARAELEAACRKVIGGDQPGGPFLPNSYNRLGLQFAGNHGGVNWGGTSVNPQLGYLFANTNELGQISGLRDRQAPEAGPARADGVGNRVDPDGPYEGVPGGGRFKDNASNMMCQQPPWRRLIAVNVNTAEVASREPHWIPALPPPGATHT